MLSSFSYIFVLLFSEQLNPLSPFPAIIFGNPAFSTGVEMRERGRERNRESVSDRPCLNYTEKGYVQHGATATATRWGKGRSKK